VERNSLLKAEAKYRARERERERGMERWRYFISSEECIVLSYVKNFFFLPTRNQAIFDRRKTLLCVFVFVSCEAFYVSLISGWVRTMTTGSVDTD
jgi:hypothetical protein